MVERREIFTDCTLCYHSCGTKVTVEDGQNLVFAIGELGEGMHTVEIAADAIRDVLQRVNIIVEDDKDGSTWRRGA